MQKQKNPFGYFDDKNREYVITRPDTPLPWLNFLGQDEFFGLCSNTAGGYTFYKDAKLRRLTRYRYNNVPMDVGGRYLYVRDGDTVWNPGWKPTKTRLDRYECRHGFGYTRITGEKDGVEVEMLFFVPSGENRELWKTTVRNKSGKKKNLRLFSFVEFCFYEALNDMTNFQRTFSIGEVEIDNGGAEIYHKTEYRERRDHYTLFGCTGPVTGYDTSRDAFIGLHNGFHEPAAVLNGQCTGSRAHGWSPVGAHQIDLELDAGQESSFTFVLAFVQQGDAPKFSAPYTVNKEKAKSIMAQYAEISAVDAAFAKLQQIWRDWLGVIEVDTPNEHLTRMVNAWNQVQCMATFNLSRSASFFESGIGRGMGFRDSNQDLLGFVHIIPDRARQRILDIAATQTSTGLCFHQYQPLTKQGNKEMGGGFMDDHLWLVCSTCAYVRETGDTSILDENVGYADQPAGQKKGTVLEHLELSLRYCLDNLGPHGLPLIGHADWNDCLNLNCFSTEPNENFQLAGHGADDSTAESVMIAGLFLYATREMAGMYRHMGREEDSARVSALRENMLKTVEEQAWDGEWYLRAFDAESNPVGSSQCKEGRIFIESQGWCIMGGAGLDNGRAARALASVDKHLHTPAGSVLQQPAYSEYYLNLGEVSSYPPGYKENAGVFSHNNTWIHIAWTLLGEGEKALDYYLSICPSAKEDIIETYRSEPYVYAQMTAGKDAATAGEAKNSWLTGTAAWSFVVATHHILGVRPEYGGLRIDPCIPREWDGFSMKRTFRGTDYQIDVRNPGHVCKGVQSMTVDGQEISGNLIPVQEGKSSVKVVVTLG